MAEGHHPPEDPNYALRQSWALSVLQVHILTKVFSGSHGLSRSWSLEAAGEESSGWLAIQTQPQGHHPVN